MSVRIAGVSLVLIASTVSAWADGGVWPIWQDFQPAISTQYRRPDGGRLYPKPNTKTLIQQQRQTDADRAATADLRPRAPTPPSRRGEPIPGVNTRNTSPDTRPLPDPNADKPPSRVGR